MHTTEQLNTALAGRYAIERRVGEGGMATVYLARDLRHNRFARGPRPDQSEQPPLTVMLNWTNALKTK